MESICVIVPIYNEEEAIPKFPQEFSEYFELSSLSASVLLVNDGSTDASLDLIEKLCLEDSRFHFISLEKNSGLSSALKAGFDYAKTDWVGYIDADLQTKPTDFLKFEPYLDHFDLVLGDRSASRKDSLVKKLSSRIANSFRDFMLHDGVNDSGCPLKILRRDLAVSIPFFKGMHRFIPALVLMNGGKVKQVPIAHFPRVTGKSKFNLWNRMLSPLQDTFAVRWMTKRNITYKISSFDILNQQNKSL
ncbi:MAG: glycosyltransferase family 2 protein [Flavobacteriaceae bacterium]|nr:glycosyltransferase family 2 protein [Flavobacteriaceae bacterium]